MSSYINPFISDYLPRLFWPAELRVFGREVQYLSLSYPSAVAVTVLWKEGASDEEVSPGRYSHMDVQNSDLPFAPALGDTVQKDGRTYDVVVVNALAVGFSTIVLQEGGPL